MHESDAMQFIEPVLRGFLHRIFGIEEGEVQTYYGPHLQKIQSFIRDDSPYWVREKTLCVIGAITSFETLISFWHDYEPTTSKKFIRDILDYVEKYISKRVEEARYMEDATDEMHITVPFPVFPKR